LILRNVVVEEAVLPKLQWFFFVILLCGKRHDAAKMTRQLLNNVQLFGIRRFPTQLTLTTKLV